MTHPAPALAVIWSAEWLVRYFAFTQRQALAVWARWGVA